MPVRSPRTGARAGAVALALVLCLCLVATPSLASPAVGNRSAATDTASDRYVIYVYESLLFRSPDPGGLAYWSGVVHAGNRNAFVNTLVSGAEWRRLWINAFYDEIWLGRQADSAGIAHWSAYLAAGGRWDGFEIAIGSSAESYARGGGTDAGFVEQVYLAAADRAPTEAEQTLGEAVLAGHSRATYVRLVLRSDAGLNNRVALAYDRTLNRLPDSGGLAYWRQYYADTGRLSRMLAAQITSAEAYNLAQSEGVAAQRGDRLRG